MKIHTPIIYRHGTDAQSLNTQRAAMLLV